MLIRVEDIKGEGLLLDYEEGVEDFPTLVEIEAAGEYGFPSALSIHLRAQRVQEMIEVEGEVGTRVRLSCSRCLKEFETTLTARFSLTYSQELPEVASESDEEEVEISAEEMGLIPFHGDEIDLREAVQEQIVMALPVRPLCEEGCKGLCPHCGADLNRRDCGCRPPIFNSKFGALKDFKPEK